jgi:hypothetical protein
MNIIGQVLGDFPLMASIGALDCNVVTPAPSCWVFADLGLLGVFTGDFELGCRRRKGASIAKVVA